MLAVEDAELRLLAVLRTKSTLRQSCGRAKKRHNSGLLGTTTVFELADQTTHEADPDFFSLSTDEENIQRSVAKSKGGANTQFHSAHRTTLVLQTNAH